MKEMLYDYMKCLISELEAKFLWEDLFWVLGGRVLFVWVLVFFPHSAMGK